MHVERVYVRHTLLEVLGGSVDELESNELEAALLETADDVANEPALDAVGLQRRDASRVNCSSGFGVKSSCHGLP